MNWLRFFLIPRTPSVRILSGSTKTIVGIISCLGLFGFAVFSLQSRLKEIAIRKVLGSGQLQILRLLLGSFVSLITIALVIAFPISYYLADNWLANFAFRIDLEWYYFIGVALFTIGTQVLQTMQVDPIKYIKDV